MMITEAFFPAISQYTSAFLADTISHWRDARTARIARRREERRVQAELEALSPSERLELDVLKGNLASSR